MARLISYCGALKCCCGSVAVSKRYDAVGFTDTLDIPDHFSLHGSVPDDSLKDLIDMTPSSASHRHDCSGLSQNPARRPVLLRGRNLKRCFSPLLIVIFLFLAPITYSNNSIPNFQPDVETGSNLRIKTVSAVAVSHSHPRFFRQGQTYCATHLYTFPSPLIPSSEQICFISPSRAPPI